MGTLILIAILVVTAVLGAILGFVLVKFFVGRTVAFVLCSIAFLGSLVLATSSFVAITVGGLAIAIDALNRDNPGPYIMIGGTLAVLVGLCLFGASIGGFVAAVMKKKVQAAS